MNDHLHIVCLDAPAPPTYGGAIDMYYKIVALAGTGKKIMLHYFEYNKKRNADTLQAFCVEINSYHRKDALKSISLSTPYIIGSRINTDLVKRLNRDDHPILLEGLHCSGILPYIINKDRVVIRMHNEEANYYRSLFSLEKNLLKRTYFSFEAFLLKKYQETIDRNIKMACLSESDIDIFKNNYGFRHLYFIPCFIPWQTVRSQPGKGNYCLYHANMAVSENEAAARWLLENVFNRINIPFVIAGSGVSKQLKAQARKYKNCKLVIDPPVNELNSLVRDAHINVLPSKNNTGVKLKLLHACFEGRFCITNNQGIAGSHIKSGIHIANNPDHYIQLIAELYEQDFTLQHIQERQAIQQFYNNPLNAQKLSELW